MVISRHILFLSLVLPGIWATSVKHPVISLDIGRQTNYRSTGQEIDVKSHKDGEETFYTHTLSKPAHLSDIMDELILSSLVYWRYDKPDMLTLNLQNSQVFLWNNGNGRLVPKSSTLDSCPNVLDRQVTIDIGKNSDGWYGPSTITSKIDIFTTMLTNPELPGYQICHNTGPPFMVKSVVDGTTPTNIKVAQEVHNVYVYRWNNVPLLVDFELLNKEFLSFANLDNKWEGIKTPKSDYRRMHYLRELLGYINCRMGNRVVIDIWVKNKYSKYHIGACKFPGMEEKKGVAVIVENVRHKYGDLNGYQEFRHKLSNNKQFDIGHIMNSTCRVIIDLPNRPVKTVSLFTRPYGYTNNPLDIVEVVTDVYEYYYKHNRDKEFVKYAVSNEPLRKTNDLLHYETGKVILWKSKVIEKRYDL